MTKKKILIINRIAPCGTANAAESLDLLLAYSAFDHEVSVVFMDEGVWQLKTGQDSTALQQKNFTAALAALPLYDINNIYVEQTSLVQRELTLQDLLLPCAVLTSEELAILIAEQDLVLGF